MGNVPAVVVAAGRDGGGCGTACGQHGRHHRVGGGEQVQQPGIGRAQRSAEHRQWPTAGLLDGPAQRLDVAGVAGQVLGAVVEHRDRRAVPVACRPVEDAPARRGLRRREAEAGHQQRVAEEGVQLPQVRYAALGEIDVGLQRDACGRRGMPHQVGVRRLLTADDDGRHTACHHGVDAVLPGAVSAKDAHDGDVGAGQQLLELAVDQPRRVRPPIARPACAGGDQVGVGRRQQQHGRALAPTITTARAIRCAV